MSRSKESPKGKPPKEDRIADHIAKVKPLEPWPAPPKNQGPQPQNLVRSLSLPKNPLQRKIKGDSFTKWCGYAFCAI